MCNRVNVNGGAEQAEIISALRCPKQQIWKNIETMMRHPVNAMGDPLVSSALVFAVACILLLRVAGQPAPEGLAWSWKVNPWWLDFVLRVLWLHVSACRGSLGTRSSG